MHNIECGGATQHDFCIPVVLRFFVCVCVANIRERIHAKLKRSRKSRPSYRNPARARRTPRCDLPKPRIHPDGKRNIGASEHTTSAKINQTPDMQESAYHLVNHISCALPINLRSTKVVSLACPARNRHKRTTAEPHTFASPTSKQISHTRISDRAHQIGLVRVAMRARPCEL